jgi:hypothetical protein
MMHARNLINEVRRNISHEVWARRARKVSGKARILDFLPRYTFIWVPKTAGTSIAYVLRKTVGLLAAHNLDRLIQADFDLNPRPQALTVGHQSLDHLIELDLLRPENIDASETFTVVRNPYTRAVSLWGYLRKKGRLAQGCSFDDFIFGVTPKNSKVGAYNQRGFSLASPMTRWTHQAHWRGPKTVIRFEDLPASPNVSLGHLTLPLELPHKNKGPNKPTVYCREQTLSRLREFYCSDFEAFSYSEEPPPGLFQITA